MRADESTCQRLFEWDEFLQLRERTIFKKSKLYTDPQYEFLLSGFITKMQSAIEQIYGTHEPYEVHLVDDVTINAAASGAQIFVNRGTMLFFLEPREFWRAQGYDEATVEYLWDEITPWENDIAALAFIIGHEVGHNVLGHPPSIVSFACEQYLQAEAQAERSTEKRTQKNAELQEKGKKVGFWRKLGRALSTTGTEAISGMLSSLELTRQDKEAELQADQVGVAILREVGLDPQAGARALGYLSDVYGYSDDVMGSFLCSDHPDILDRIARAETLGSQLSVASRYGSPEWPHPVDLSSSRLGYLNLKTRQAYKQEDYESALRWIDLGLNYYPEDANLVYNKACMLALLGESDEAVPLLEKALALDSKLVEHAASDPDLLSLLEDPRFANMLEHTE